MLAASLTVVVSLVFSLRFQSPPHVITFQTFQPFTINHLLL
jgi:hypothetical protein